MIDPCSLSEGDRFHAPLELEDGQLVANHDRQVTYEIHVGSEHRLDEIPPEGEVLIEVTEVGERRAEAKVVSSGLNAVVDGL